jgi:uncharacterized protein
MNVRTLFCIRDDRALEKAEGDFVEHFEAVRPVELSDKVAREAGDLARQHALRGADAIHLASVAILATRDVIVVTWDRRMHAGALAMGFSVAPAKID